jgi:hypothetical protein
LNFKAFLFLNFKGANYLQPPKERFIDIEIPVLQVDGFGVQEGVGVYPPVLHDGFGAV